MISIGHWLIKHRYTTDPFDLNAALVAGLCFLFGILDKKGHLREHAAVKMPFTAYEASRVVYEAEILLSPR